MSTSTLPSPVAYPEVTVGGVKYRVKFGWRALYELNGLGLDIADLNAATKIYTDQKKWFRLVVDAGCCALSDPATGKSTPMTPAALLDTLGTDEFEPFAKAVEESLWGKPSPAAATGDTAKPASESSTISDGSTPGPSGPVSTA
jgi:hypothetical protein